MKIMNHKTNIIQFKKIVIKNLKKEKIVNLVLIRNLERKNKAA